MNREKEMEAVPATHIERRLVMDKLSCLTAVLQKHHNKVIIAGSYTFAIHPEEENKPEMGPGDIDIWIPWSEEPADGPKILGDLLTCLMGSGYSDVSSRHQALPDNLDVPLLREDSYKRMDYMIETIYTVRNVHDERLRKVQIVVLQKEGGSDPQGVIQHFDLNISRQYYDGKHICRPLQVGDDVRASCITLNTDSDVIRKQSFGEWVRTLRRIRKYSLKGLTMDPSVIQKLYELVPGALDKGKCSEWSRIQGSRSMKYMSFVLQSMSYILEWNQLVKVHPLLPSIAFTVIPPGRYVSDVRLVLCKNPIVPDYPERTAYFGVVVYDSMPTKHYNRLSVDERKTLVVPTGTTKKSKSIFISPHAPGVHVSSLVPYPSLTPPPGNDRECTSLPRECLDTSMLTEVDVLDYMREGENSDTGQQDHFVWYFQPREGSIKAYGISREMIKHAQTFVPCVDIDTEWGAWSKTGSLVTLGVDQGLSFNIPKAQLLSLLYPPVGQTRHLYEIVSTEYSWDRSRRLHVNNGDNFEGGFANNCQDDTARTISFLEHILCCPDEWFASVPVQHVTGS